MTCKVRIVEDSINRHNGVRLTTFELSYWRSIHGEVMTHRVFSRNASSSRAIPIKTFLKQVWNNPAGPIHWGKNKSGMQAKEELTGFKLWFAKKIWNLSGKMMCGFVWVVDKVASPHKQTFNRLLEPWQYISVIVTATEYDNFFELRIHEDAQPEIYELAFEMKTAMDNSIPVIRDYHLPYVTLKERAEYPIEVCWQLSTARCARVSYLTHDGKSPNVAKDIKLHDALVGSKPIHASPTEHSASAIQCNKDNWFKNLRGWSPYRILVEKRINEDNNNK